MKNKFADTQEKHHFLNKLLLELYGELADDTIKLLNFPPITFNSIEHTPEYYINLVKHYVMKVSDNFDKLNESRKYTIELEKWELTNIDLSYYLNTLKLKAGAKIVNIIYYNSRDLLV